MKKIIFAFAVVVLCLTNNFAQQNSSERLFEIKGTIKNQEKIVLAGLTLYFEYGQSRDVIVTGENGDFVAKLPVGKYKITANAAVSKTFAAFVEVFDNNLNPTNFELIIETDKFCCSPMSDGKMTEVIEAISPPFPPAARAVGARGEVVVTVKIDSEGKVISAKAETGHPLLRAASESTAKKWLFSSDKNGTDRDGKIIFAFVLHSNETTDLFIKPNRLVRSTTQYVINSTGTH